MEITGIRVIYNVYSKIERIELNVGKRSNGKVKRVCVYKYGNTDELF